MSSKSADRNLLIGALAVQMEFVDRDQLIQAMNSWLLDKSIPLDAILEQQSAIDNETHRLLVGLVDKHISMHAGDTSQSLASLSQTVGMPEALSRIADPEVQETLNFLSPPEECDDPLSTVLPQASVRPSAGAMRYTVLRAHNSGGLGTVSVASDEELGREVALKEIKKSFADDPESRRRFLIEAEVTGCLEHPGIVPVYGLGQYSDGRPYYAMRFIRGESFQAAIDRFRADEALNQNPRQRELELRKLLRRLIDVCNAMEYAHSRGVLHRDLKPDNVMLGKFGETLVVDWGLAKTDDQLETSLLNEQPLRLSAGGNNSSTQMGKCMGTPAFMSPEQASGRIDLLNPTSDVYSLGAILYCILTGVPPINPGGLEQILRQVRSGEFKRPSVQDPRVPRALEAICLRAMALEPGDRYPSAASFATDLERWLADESVSACVEPLTHRIARWSRQHRTLVSSLTAGTLASIVILSFSLVFLLSANARERKARNTADAERSRAESNLAVAKQAVSTMLTEVGREELAQFPQMEQTREKLFAKARSFYDEFLKQRPSDASLRFEWAIALRNLAEIDRLVDNHEQAERRYLQSIAEIEALATEQPSNPIYRRQLAIFLNEMGMLVRSRAAGRAESFFDQAIDLQRVLLSNDANPELAQEMARSLYNRGMIRAEQGNRVKARSDANAAIEVLQKILNDTESADVSVTQELARAYNNMANLLQAMDDDAAAQLQYSNAIELLEAKVLQETRDRDLVKELAIYQNNYANFLRAQGQLADADQSSQQAIERLSSLAQPLPFLSNELANAHHSRGVILSQRQLPKQAEEEYEMARTILERLVSDFPDVSIYHDRLGNAYFQLGTMRFQAERNSDAVLMIQDAMREHEAALRLRSDEPDFRQHLKNDYVGLILIRIRQGRHADAFKLGKDFSKNFAADAQALFDAASSARCIPVAESDAEMPSELERDAATAAYTTHAVDSLRAAGLAGFHDLDKLDSSMQETGAFYSLRDNVEVQSVLEQLRLGVEIR